MSLKIRADFTGGNVMCGCCSGCSRGRGCVGVCVVVRVPLSNFSSALHQFVPWLGSQTVADAPIPSSSGIHGTRHYVLLAFSRWRGQTLSLYDVGTNSEIYTISQANAAYEQIQSVFFFGFFFLRRYLVSPGGAGGLHPLYLFMSISQNWICMPSSFNTVFLYGNSAGKYLCYVVSAANSQLIPEK